MEEREDERAGNVGRDGGRVGGGGKRQVAERKRGERCNEGDREVNSHAETELS